MMSRSLLFERWPRFAFRHRWFVVGAALTVLVGLSVLYGAARGTYGDAFSIPGAESQRLFDLLHERFPATAGDSASVVVATDAGIADPAVEERIRSFADEIRELPGVAQVNSPYDPEGRISKDGKIAIIDVQYAESALDIEVATIRKLLDWREQASSDELQVEVGGTLLRRAEMEPPGSAEIVGITAAVVILLLAFGSVVAMGLPIATALLGLVSSFFLVGVGANFFKMPSFTPQFSAMVGIGVGIDYALLIVTRFREAKGTGSSLEHAILVAMNTAGRSVLFAGSTVVVALLGLWAAGIPAVGYVGTATSLVVALAVIVALLVLPAILSIAGNSIDRWRLPGLHAPAHESESGFGYRLSRVIQRYPLLWFVLTLAVLLVLALPALDMRLGSSDAGNSPQSFSSRRAYDLLARGFGPGFNGPILLGFSIDRGETEAVDQLPAALAKMENVALVSPASFNQDRTAAIIRVVPGTAPQEEETKDLVYDLREDLRRRFSGTGIEPYVGGPTALYVDLGQRIGSRLPFFIAGVIGVSFLLLMAIFRSVVVPLKAAIMNLLSIGASFGVLVAIFQWGWLGDVVGVHREGPIESFMPMMLFAVLFGLSMDYEVFLVSRIREEYLRTGDNTESVARGLSVTTRVISAAAAIMIAVFLAFALSDQRIVKEFGIGLATAIFIDATIVRLVLVPSVMQLMGRANWWFPRWLDRIVPNISAAGGETTKQGEQAPF
jgi:RND superfamily putative drug exporter